MISILQESGTRQATLRIESRPVAEASEVHQAIEAFGGQGWICTTGRAFRYDGGSIEGLVLGAEVSDGARRSLHVRQAQEGWLITELSEEAGGEHLMQEEHYLSTEGEASLAYAVYWRKSDEGGVEVWSPWAARFMGWR